MKFYSEKLDKIFDTEKDLIAAETAEEAKTKKKAAEAKAKKDEANKVQELYVAQNAAIKKFNESLVELRNVYNKAVRDARAEFEKGTDIITKERDAVVKAYDEALADFINKHPEGYHLTLKDKDSQTILSGTAKTADFVDEYTDLIGKIANLLKF